MSAAAADRINAAEIVPGSVIMVELSSSGELVSTRRKRDALTVRVTGKDLVNVPGRRNRMYVIHTTGGTCRPAGGVQTFTIGKSEDVTELPADQAARNHANDRPASDFPATDARSVDCTDHDGHQADTMGCPPYVMKCKGVPARAEEIARKPIVSGPRATGSDVVGSTIAAALRFRHTVTAVEAGYSDPYARGNVRQVSTWSMLVDGHRVTVVGYEGRHTLSAWRSLVAILVDGQMIAAEIDAARPPGTLAGVVAYRVGDAIEAYAAGSDSPPPAKGDRVTFTAKGERRTGTVVRAKRDGLITVDVPDSDGGTWWDVRPDQIEAPAGAGDQAEAPAPAGRNVWTFGDSGEAYSATQCRDEIGDGDVIHVPSERVTGLLMKAWPVAVTAERGELHGGDLDAMRADGYGDSIDQARALAESHGYALSTIDGDTPGVCSAPATVPDVTRVEVDGTCVAVTSHSDVTDPAPAGDFDQADRCTGCREHIGDPCAPDCPRDSDQADEVPVVRPCGHRSEHENGAVCTRPAGHLPANIHSDGNGAHWFPYGVHADGTVDPGTSPEFVASITGAPAVGQADGEPTGDPVDPAPAGESFGTWEALAEHIRDGAEPFPPVGQADEQAPASEPTPAGRPFTVANDARGNLRVHRPGCQDIAREIRGGGTSWDVTAPDLRGIVTDLYGGGDFEDFTPDRWADFSADFRVMPCAGDVPGEAPAGSPVPRPGEYAGTVQHVQAEPHTFEPDGADRTHCGAPHGSAKCGRLESSPIHQGGNGGGEPAGDPVDPAPAGDQADDDADVPAVGYDSASPAVQAWRLLGAVTSTGSEQRTRMFRAMRRVHGMPDMTDRAEIMRDAEALKIARDLDSRSWPGKCAAYLRTYAALLTEDDQPATLAAEPAPAPRWSDGKPKAGHLVTVPALNRTDGQRAEGVTLVAERVTALGCGCYRIESDRPGPYVEGGRQWVAVLTGCTFHGRTVCTPEPTVGELLDARRRGAEWHADGVPVDALAAGADRDETVSAMIKRYPVGDGAQTIREAFRVGYATAAKFFASAAPAMVEQAHALAEETQKIADRNPAAQDMADLHARQAGMCEREQEARNETAEQARALAAGTAGAAPVEHRTRTVLDADQSERYKTKSNGSAGRFVRSDTSTAHCSCGWSKPAGTRDEARMLARGHRSDMEAAAGTPVSEPAPAARVTPKAWVTAHLTDGQRAALGAPAEEAGEAQAPGGGGDDQEAPAPAAGVAATHPAPDGRMVKRPTVGDYIHTDGRGVCEVVAVHGRGGEDVGVRTAAGERVSLTRHHRGHWLVVAAPAVDQADDEDDTASDEDPRSLYRLPVEAYTPERGSDDGAEITIRHDHEDGTVIEGSTRGDGVWEIAKAHGMEFRRGVIFKRHTRDRFADLHALAKLAGALREAGHTVAVEVDDVWRPASDREDARAVRVSERAGRLAERASRQYEQANTRLLAARSIADGMPFGEPIKVGHHSERRHRRAFERIEANDRASYAARDYAQELARRADAAERNEAGKQGPRAIMRRVETLKTDRRAWLRRLADTDKGTTGYARTCRLHIERLSEDIAFQLAKLGDLAASGVFVAWSAESVQRGDLVDVGGDWREVARVNRKGVSVRALYQWHTREDVTPVAWEQIHGRRRDGMQWDAPNATPWPIEQAQKVARWDSLMCSQGVTHDRNDTAAIFQRVNVSQALRLVLGVRKDATAQEVAAYGEPADVAGKRARALACADMFDRLEAGEKFDQIAGTVAPIGDTVPRWTMPAGEPVEVFPRDLAPGDIVAGVMDDSFGVRRLSTAFVGPVTAAPVHLDRRESGDWEVITLDGVRHEVRSFRRFMVHRTGQH